MGCSRGPAERRARGFDGVSDILAIAIADFANKLAGRIVHGTGIAAIGARLLAANIHFCGLVEMPAVEWVCRLGRGDLGGWRWLEVSFPSRLEVGTHAFTTAFAAIA